jgi:hypothetical protein
LRFNSLLNVLGVVRDSHISRFSNIWRCVAQSAQCRCCRKGHIPSRSIGVQEINDAVLSGFVLNVSYSGCGWNQDTVSTTVS